jgi:hypothetical protein
MNRLVLLGIFAGGLAIAADPNVATCFKVNALLKMDGDHYWADWKNSCPYTIDSVYIAVEFADRGGKKVGNGLWALHLVGPGLSRVIRLSTPLMDGEFQRIRVRKITTDLETALGRTRSASSAAAQ